MKAIFNQLKCSKKSITISLIQRKKSTVYEERRSIIYLGLQDNRKF